MSLSKTFLAGVLTLSSLGLATSAQAQDETVCLDGSVANGDCILVFAPQPSDDDRYEEAEEYESDDEDEEDDD